MCDLLGVIWSLPASSRASLEDKNHRHLIVSLSNERGECLSVSLTTYKPLRDNSENPDYGILILQSGEMPLIDHPTIPYYCEMAYRPADAMRAALAAGKLVEIGRADAAVLFKVQAAALRHRLVSAEKKQLIQASMSVP